MKKIETVGIIGAGTMGAALSQKFAQEGFQVIMADREEKFLERGRENIRLMIMEGVEKRIFTPQKLESILSKIRTTVDLQELSDCQIVIEAVFEDLTVKTELFSRISSLVPDNTVLASNTSSFSIGTLAEAVTCPERFIGLHFFYHAAKNRLVEIVRGKQTSNAVFLQVMQFMQRCGKDPIVCKDANGFVVNRFFVPWLNESVRIYEEGIAPASVIDSVACQIFGCGMGPFSLMNATGVPIAYHAQKTLFDVYGEFYRPASALQIQAESGEDWKIDGPEIDDPDTYTRISDRLIAVTLIICGQLLDENICSAGDITRGAGIGLRWRKTPVDIYHLLGYSKVQKIIKPVLDVWQLKPPRKMAYDNWQPDYIRSEKNDRVGILTINRPEGLNAINPVLIDQLETGFLALNSDQGIDTIIFTGMGKAFVAGADIKFFLNHMKKGEYDDIVSFTAKGQRLFDLIDHSEKNIIAFVNGLTLGGGLELALAADSIIALDKAVFAFPETGIGIYPGLGGTQRTIGRIGKNLTKYLIFSGQFLSAGKAYNIGLIDKVVQWDEFTELMKYPGKISISQKYPTRDWLDIDNFIEGKSVDRLLSIDTDDPEWGWLSKKLKLKAPLALSIAEKLIDKAEGPASELRFLEEIFKTEDAMNGLQSAGGKPPVFQGK